MLGFTQCRHLLTVSSFNDLWILFSLTLTLPLVLSAFFVSCGRKQKVEWTVYFLHLIHSSMIQVLLATAQSASMKSERSCAILLVSLHLKSSRIFQISSTPGANYAWAFYGKLEIKQPGTYTICVTSDDGSFLYVDSKELVNNDGLHGKSHQQLQYAHCLAKFHVVFILICAHDHRSHSQSRT